ncbi:MAG TPA: hypothetical protein VNZ62_22090 [Capillimicrobium sp.]|nr:hypothetical protein [Capillimicrobium sp.]
MIVRISTEGQYDLPERFHAELNELDNRVVAAVEADSEDDYRESFAALLDFVRSNGTPVEDTDLRGSDLIIPPPDLTLAEAEQEFTGDGLLPD